MDASDTPDRALPYTEHNVVALLDSQGGRLYRYFWVMLGEEVSVTRALAGTIIVALPYPDHRELFEIARTVCRQQPLAPAMAYTRPEAPTLAAATKAALRRLEPDDREICVLGAPAYRLTDDDLAAVLGTLAVGDLWSRAMDVFAVALAACAAEAGLEHGEDLAERALELFGAGRFPLPYDEIVALATDPAARWLRDGIRARAAGPAGTATAGQGGLELLGTGSLSSITVQGMENAERLTVPMPRMPRKAGHHSSHRRRTAMAGSVLAAGAIPVALAMAWAAHSGTSGIAAVPPLSAAGGSAPAGAAPSPAHGHGSANPSNGYQGRHARPEPGGAAAGTSGTSGTSGTTSAYTSTGMTGAAPAAPASTTGTTTGTGTATKTTTETATKTTTETATKATTGTKTTTGTGTRTKTTTGTSTKTTTGTGTRTTTTTTHGNGNSGADNGQGNGGINANGGTHASGAAGGNVRIGGNITGG